MAATAAMAGDGVDSQQWPAVAAMAAMAAMVMAIAALPV